ncbi:hypothetical protein M426DRAFT_320952 [Hypoxylon sp. CI-4A]|nr:hypothetical protein M426DRAFT_320952 [Hypoxylon sp. CI-4A]
MHQPVGSDYASFSTRTPSTVNNTSTSSAPSSAAIGPGLISAGKRNGDDIIRSDKKGESTVTLNLYGRGPSHDHDSPGSGDVVVSHPDPDHDHDSSISFEDQRTKKRRVGPSSRGVASLTPEQLAKKRANDREAQRAIRERTKNQIETLENRIRDLTSQKPYQDLQAAIQAKQAVEAENAEIKARLASVMSLIQPILSGNQQDGATNSSSPFPSFTSGQTAPRSHSAPTTSYNASTPLSAASPASAADSTWQTQTQPHPSPNFTQVKLLNQQRHDLLHNLDLGAGEQLKLDFLLDPSQRDRMQTGIRRAQGTPDYQYVPMKHDWTSTSSYAIASGGPQEHRQQYRIEYAHQGLAQHADTSWIGVSAPIKNSPPACPLDSLLLDFLHERRQRAAEGVPTREVIGPRYPSVSSLLNPASSAFAHPISKVFTDILAAFPGISGLPERVAVLYMMFLMMRWQISPTRENYDRLPPWAAPTPAQVAVPHPAWLDHVPFPAMRARLATAAAAATAADNNHDPTTSLLFYNFFLPFTTTLSVNWPYEDTDALLQQSPAGASASSSSSSSSPPPPPSSSELLINPVFERHLRRLDNWSLGDEFDRAFPALRGTYNLKTRREGQFNGG